MTKMQQLLAAVAAAALLIGGLVGFAIGNAGGGDSSEAKSSKGLTQTQLDAYAARVEKTAEDTRQDLADQQNDLDVKNTELEDRAAELDDAEAAASANTIPGDGTFIVNTDVKPGTYRSTDNFQCYWERNADVGGDGDIIANDNIEGQGIVKIEKSDAVFITTGCSDWKLVD